MLKYFKLYCLCCICCLCLVVGFFSFYNNSFKVAHQKVFNTFQHDSEALVIGKIIADREHFNIENGGNGGNLAYVSKHAFVYEPFYIYQGYELLQHSNLEQEDIVVTPYSAQYGIQGLIDSFLYNTLKFHIETLYAKNAFLLAAVVTALTFLFRKILGKEFAVIFFFSMVLSPWVVSFARNLYWVPFTWFLPAVFSGLLYVSTQKNVRAACLFFLYASFLFKCLAGYEYISTSILFAASFFMLDGFLESPRYLPRNRFNSLMCVLSLGVLAFLSALLLHAWVCSDSLSQGFVAISLDAKRRTYGDLRALPLGNIIKTYLFNWKTSLVAGISGKYFSGIIAVAFLTILYQFCTKHITWRRNLGLVVVFALGPLSWFVLAQGHASDHFHMNYVLWYFGFVAACFYVTYEGLRRIGSKTLQQLYSHIGSKKT